MDSNTKEGLVWFIASFAVLGIVGAVTINHLENEKTATPAPLVSPEEDE